MFTYDCLLAAALLTSPALHADDITSWFEPLRSSLLIVGVEAEVLDRREVTNRLAEPHSFAEDLQLLQGRFAELAHAPLLEECKRFPKRAMVADFLAFNREYRQDLIAQIALDPLHAEELHLAVMETDQLFRIWESLRDAQCEYYYIHVRRKSLQMLRCLVGAEAFYSGQLPPHVPVWRLPEWK